MLRVGLLIDGAELRWFDAELVRRLGPDRVVLVIQQQLPRRSLAGRIRRAWRRGTLVRSAVFRLAVWLERRLIAARHPGIEDLFRTITVDKVCDSERLPLAPIVSPSGCVHRFADADVQAIKACQLDVILRMGSGILRGEILSAARHGVLSFHHGDNRTHRGGPAGFWEVLERRDCTGYMVQRLTEELDAGEVLARGELGTRPRYLVNQHHLFKCSLQTMLDVLVRLERGGSHPREAPAADWYSAPVYSIPRVADTLRYLGAQAGRAAAGLARRLLVQRNAWELRVYRGDWQRLVAARAAALPVPRGKFWADPFVVRRGGGPVILFEEYEFARGKAHIAALVGAPDGRFAYAGPVISAPYHLSFPFVFEHAGQLYMCPETHEAHRIELWRCVSWPLEWRFERVLMDGVDACDSMLVEHGGRWWLLSNLERDGAGDFGRELHAFHADSPLAPQWTPHAANPVVTGASRARNAGLLRRDGRLFRLAQAQGFDRYGSALQLFEITQLSAQGYAEQPVARLEPARDRGELGVHHLSASGDTVVFDVLRAHRFWTPLSVPARFRPSPRASAAALPARAPRSSPTRSG
ncbi:MAG TPA: hypothetical protein VJ789_06740 [Burkholderiales bacterium]|nr:hypothetical protein [Burkholderiales bacterium]